MVNVIIKVFFSVMHCTMDIPMIAAIGRMIRTRHARKLVLRNAAIWAVVVAAVMPSTALRAEAQDGIITRGDAVVTEFAGTKTDKTVPADVHPLDRTFIDLDGTSAEVLDLSQLGTAPRGQVSDAVPKLKIKAADIGQVFGVTLDDAKAPNAYVTATSLFGLQIVAKESSGQINRLVSGADNAQWMPGQFGPGGPGAIYKIDGVTGKATLFATIKLEDRDNAGPGLGNITFDPRTRQLFVSDLETGMIHRVTLDGKIRDAFDHGEAGRKAQSLDVVAFDDSRALNIEAPSFNTETPSTWGYADARRRVFGLAVSQGRLYYGVAEGPSVWSVSIDDEGDFGSDVRIELEPKGTNTNSDITDIVFDGAGIMILSQRGAVTGNYDYTTFAKPQASSVLKYKWSEKEGRWLDAPDEYAIGLKKNHLATQGGVALNYGYDKFGNINFGACRQTLWTTGEHLRDGDDIARVSTGGARIVSGLQGNYKSRVRPDNAPPYETWFVDSDGRHDDAQAFGHVGDVAIYAPCEPSKASPPPAGTDGYVPSDPDWYPPLPPPLDEPGLTVEKKCHAGAIGGLIRCTILVRNLTGRIVSQDIKFTDVTRTMFGPGAGSVIPIASATPLVPGIACAATPTLDFWCTMPAALLLPGDAVGVDVFIDTHDLALAGNVGFRNCAYLKHPDGYSKACAEGGTDIIVEKFGPGQCLPGGTCKFGLKIANVGLMPYNGNVLLADAMFVGGAVVNAPVTAVNPAIPCIAGNTNQLPFTCVTPLSLMPGEEHIHWIDVTMPAPGGYWAHNCFGALDPALMPVGPVPPGLGLGGVGAGNPSCVWVHVPVPKANLKLKKTALNGGLCDKVGANLHCKYEIAVRNEDAVAFNAPLAIKETVPAGASVIAATAPWACAGGPPDYTCNTGGAVAIPPGGVEKFNVTVSIPVAVSEASFCQVPNTAKITMPAGGAAPNLDATDDQSAATASTFGLFWEDPITGITFVMCDPTNLKVQKTASGPCEKSGDGYACAYKVTVTNTGPDPYKGPVKVKEHFGSTPLNVSFGGDFTCNGGGADYTCETPIIPLAKGASLTLDVKAKVTGDGVCDLANTATMVHPPVGSKGNGDGTDDSASATADVPAPSCKERTITPVPPVVKRCPDGLPVPRSGRCPCADGKTWDREAMRCVGDEPEQPEGCKPGVNEVRLDNGRCVCRDGYIKASGRCVKDDDDEPQGCTPGPNEVKTAKGNCVCAPDFSRNSDGRCVEDKDEPQGCTPGRNEHKTSKGRCICDDGFERNAKGVCMPESNPADDCKDKGWRWTGSRCVPPADPGADCRNDGGRWVSGKCIYPPSPADECKTKGWRWTGSRCIPPADPGADCRKDGGRWTGSKCVYPKDPAVECRDDGGKWTGSRCVFPPKDPPKKYCPEGTHGTWPNCKRDRPDPPKKCPPGMIGPPGDCHFPKPPKIEVPIRPIKPPNIRPISPIKPNFVPRGGGGGPALNFKKF